MHNFFSRKLTKSRARALRGRHALILPRPKVQYTIVIKFAYGRKFLGPRFSSRKSIGFPKLYRLTSSFFALHKYFDVQIWGQCVMPGVVWWVPDGQNLPYNFKNSYGDFHNRNFEKSHRTTGPRSDLRPDL